MDELNTEMYKNFEIGKADLFGATVYTVRPTNYAHDAYNFHHGGTDDLGHEFWHDADTLEEAYAVIDGFDKWICKEDA